MSKVSKQSARTLFFKYQIEVYNYNETRVFIVQIPYCTWQEQKRPRIKIGDSIPHTFYNNANGRPQLVLYPPEDPDPFSWVEQQCPGKAKGAIEFDLGTLTEIPIYWFQGCEPNITFISEQVREKPKPNVKMSEIY